jgi:hypothetical protein
VDGGAAGGFVLVSVLQEETRVRYYHRVIARNRGDKTWIWLAEFRYVQDARKFVGTLKKRFSMTAVVKDEVI